MKYAHHLHRYVISICIYLCENRVCVPLIYKKTSVISLQAKLLKKAKNWQQLIPPTSIPLIQKINKSSKTFDIYFSSHFVIFKSFWYFPEVLLWWSKLPSISTYIEIIIAVSIITTSLYWNSSRYFLLLIYIYQTRQFGWVGFNKFTVHFFLLLHQDFIIIIIFFLWILFSRCKFKSFKVDVKYVI